MAFLRITTAAAVLAAAISWHSPANADGPVTPTGKGIAGGTLLGAEVVMIPIGIAGVDKWWAYLLGGGLGAAGGAVGGYFVETKATSNGQPLAEPSLYMLAGGLALIIPTVVLTLNATAYKPEVEEGEVSSDEPGGDAAPGGGELPQPEGVPGEPGVGPQPTPPGQPPAVSPGTVSPGMQPPAPGGGGGAKNHKHRRPYLPPALLGIDLIGNQVALRPGIPAVDVKPLYSSKELSQYGVAQSTEVSFPMVSGRF